MDFENFLLSELYEAYYKARINGKRKTQDEHRFEANEQENLVRLRDSIIARTYKPSRGVAFIIKDPVTREVFAAPFPDRIVHHFAFKHTDSWWGHRLLPCAYSCREDKGTREGIYDLQHKIRRVSQNGTKKTVVVKCDFRGYFMSIPHQKAYQRIVWGLNQQSPDGDELCRTLKFLWHQIIFDDPAAGVTIRGRKSDWHDLPADKSLFTQPKDRGQVIGNLTSQQLSNIYLDQLDRFVVITLGLKNYGRYVDDFFFVLPTDQLDHFLAEILPQIEQFTHSLDLTLHPKKLKIIPIEEGVDFLGAKVYHDHIVPGQRISQNYADTIYKLATTGEGKLDSITSYDGHLAHFSSHKLSQKLWNGVGWDYPYPQLTPKQKQKQKNKRNQHRS